MRVLILLDRPIARRERIMLSRLEIGLADEGVRVLHAVPRAILVSESAGLYSRTVGYDPAGFPIPTRVRARALVSALDAAISEAETGGVDLVHCFAPATWRLGLETARELGAAAAIEVWSLDALAGASETLSHTVRPSLMIADPALLKAAADRFPVHTVHSTPWGVHGELLQRESLSSDRIIGVLMLVSGTHPAHVSAAIHGFAAAAARDPRLMAFINTERATGHAVWRMLRRLNLADRVSLIPDAEARRETILNLDALIIPEPSGRLRTMPLDAMACGMPVIAAPDPALTIYLDGITARLVERADAAAWEQAFVDLATGREHIAKLTNSAAAWVATNRPASAHVASVLRAYDAILGTRSTPTLA